MRLATPSDSPRSAFYSLLSRPLPHQFVVTPPMPFAFEKLVVYQKSISFSNSICTITRDFPRSYYFLVDQLNARQSPSPRTLPRATAASPGKTAAISSASVRQRVRMRPAPGACYAARSPAIGPSRDSESRPGRNLPHVLRPDQARTASRANRLMPTPWSTLSFLLSTLSRPRYFLSRVRVNPIPHSH